MEEKRHSRRDFAQNIIITLLTLSAVVLMAQTQLYNLGSAAGARYLGGLLSPEESVPGGQSQETFQLTAPVRVAVSGAYGRYGDMTMTAADERFLLLGNLLGEALGSAKTYVEIDQEAFLGSLGKTSVYYDFLACQPLSALAELIGTTTQSQRSARRLVVAAEETGVKLYLWDGGSEFGVCETAVTPATTFFLAIMGIIASFKVFDLISVMTNGGPGNATSVMAYYIYKTAFNDYKMGYACALAWALFLVIFIVTLFQWKFQSRYENE